MRKRLIFILTLTCMMIFTMSFGTVSTAFAADDDASGSYEYVVKIYPGLKGTYKGNAKVTTLHKKLGESVSMNVYTDVEVTDDRYYARGFRIAGHDHDEMEGETISGFTVMNFKVEQDVNYVVAYGIKGEMVPYTIRYVDDASGKSIEDEDTYYGMPGDKPVVSFKYIEGYEPKVFNLTKKLTKDASQNVFEFRYTVGSSSQTSTTIVNRVAPAAPGTPANPAGTNVAAANGANAGNAGNAAANNGAANIGDNATPLADGPQQFTDLDDAETPTASGPFQFAKLLPYIGGGLAVVLIVLALLWFILRKKKGEGMEEAVAEAEEEAFKHVYK